MLNKFNFGGFFCPTLGVSCFGQVAVLETMPPLKLNAPIDGGFVAGETQTFALRLGKQSIRFACFKSKRH